MKIRPMGAEFFYSGRRTERNDESNIRFSKILRTRPQIQFILHTEHYLSVCSEVITVYFVNLKKVKYFVLTKHRLPDKSMWLVNYCTLISANHVFL